MPMLFCLLPFAFESSILTQHPRYMKDSKLVESGTHEELLKKDGGYASMYKVQAEAFTDKPTNDSKVEDKTGNEQA
jgi:hypothetical protein